jgi:hypothetical protein
MSELPIPKNTPAEIDALAPAEYARLGEIRALRSLRFQSHRPARFQRGFN